MLSRRKRALFENTDIIGLFFGKWLKVSETRFTFAFLNRVDAALLSLYRWYFLVLFLTSQPILLGVLSLVGIALFIPLCIKAEHQ